MRGMDKRSLWLAWLLLVATLGWSARADASIIVNSSLPVTKRVTVNISRAALDDGSSPATVFGNAEQRADIEAKIDQIWAQAGIDIDFLPNIVPFNSTFALRGNNGSSARSSIDLYRIFDEAENFDGVIHADPSVLNVIFVDVVPQFPPLDDWSAAGLAWNSANGVIAYSGDNLLSAPGNRDVIATVVAHEIGHNLGLLHTPNGQANLMSPMGTSQQLTTEQINKVLQSTAYVKPLSQSLEGDYNANGIVDAADYIVWRMTSGQSGSALAADGNNNGRIDIGDFTVWRDHFGATMPTGSGSIASTPEPTSILMMLLSLMIGSMRRGQTRRTSPSRITRTIRFDWDSNHRRRPARF
jgi:Metallo-peptidase family M12B Reprolysin-like